jgi:VWFA-related protein
MLSMRAGWIGIFVALCCSARADSPGDGPEVSINLVVHDKHGHAVRDLTAAEIAVTDAGAKTSVRTLVPPGLRNGERRENAIVLLFDSLGPDAGRLVHEGAAELVKGLDEADARASVLAVGTRLGVIEPFTNDRAALKKAIDLASGPGDKRGPIVTKVEEEMRRAPGPGHGLTPRLLLEAVSAAERAARDQRAQPAIAAILGLERTLASLPGRKAIVYFSAGLRLATADSALFQSLISECNRGGVSVYTVDANQTTALSQVEAMQAVSSVAALGATPTIAAPAASASNHPTGMQGYAIAPHGQFESVADAMPTGAQDALYGLAVSTGGLFATATDDLKKHARRILEDESSFYQLSYAPLNSQMDGQFHKIAVKLERKDLVPQAANGYLALAGASSPLAAFEAPVRKAIREKTAVEDPDIRVKVFDLRPGGESANGTSPDDAGPRASEATAEIAVEIPLGHFEVQEVSAEKVSRMHFSVLALVTDEAGREQAKVGEDVPWRVASEVKARAMAEPLTWTRPFRVAPGKYRVEIAVLDRFAGKVSLAHAEFESKPVAGPAVGELVAVKSFEIAPPSSDTDELLLYDGQRVVPVLTGPGTTEDGELPIFFVLYPGAGLKGPLQLAVQVVGRGVSSKEAPMDLGPHSATMAIPYVVNIPTRGLPGGEYKVRVVFSHAGVRTERSADFVLPGAPLAATGPEVTSGTEDDELPSTTTAIMPAKRADGIKLPEGEQKAVLEGARTRALAYSASLPNFTCMEITRRSALKSGSREWKPQDTMSEVLRYLDGKEERKLIEVNGVRTDADRSSLEGALTSGEFGHLLKAVFGEKPQANFTWTETAFVDGARCEVFGYRVERKHSQFLLSTKDGHWSAAVAYSGTVYVDAATFNIRRLTVEAADIAKDFPIRASRFTFEYGYVRVGDADYLLPVSGVVEMAEGKKSRVRNEVQFRDYHRLGSQSSVKYSGQ